MGDDGSSLTAGTDGFIGIRSGHQRQVLGEVCDWLIDFERRSQRDGLRPEEVDASLDQLIEAMALRRRLEQRALALAVPLGIVGALIDELAERVEQAAQCRVMEHLGDLSELLVQLERLPAMDG